MKFQYNEREGYLEMLLTPENPKETAQLLRFSNNAKAQKPSVFLSFSSDEPWCSITMAKRVGNKADNSINPFRKK